MTHEETQGQVAEIRSLTAQVRGWRIAVAVLSIVVLLGGALRVTQAVRGLTTAGPGQEEFVAELGTGLKRDVVPLVGRVASQTFNELKPAVDAELRKLDRRSPELLAALEKEIILLTTNLTKRTEKVLDRTFGQVLSRREQKIRQLFPEVTQQNVADLVANLATQGEKQMDDVVTRLFGGHLESLHDITRNLERIHQQEAGSLDEEVATWEMASLLYDVLLGELKESQPGNNLAPQTP
jgi:hypothetical protein